LGGDSVFLITSDPNGRKIIILDSDLRILDTIKIFFIPGAYYAPRIAVFDGKGVFYSFSDDSSSYLYLYSLLNKSWKLVLKRPGAHLFLMKNRYIIFGDSLYKIESNFNVTPVAKIERPLLIDSFGDENDSTVIFSYTSAGRCVNLVTVNKFNENVEKRKICFGSQFSYSDNVTLSQKGKIYFSVFDSITSPPYYKFGIKVFEIDNNLISEPSLLYIYTGDSLSLGSWHTALKYHNNFIYGAGYTQFLDHYSTFFTLFNLETKQLQSYIRVNDAYYTAIGEFIIKREIEYFSCEVAYGYGQTKVRKYVLNHTSVDDLNQSREYVLYQNYPNPFNPITKIRYKIKENGVVNLIILDALGRQIAKLIDGYQEKGTYEIEFDASKHGLSTGVYFYKLTIKTIKNQSPIIKKMIFIK
jgi:hypothetical protein